MVCIDIEFMCFLQNLSECENLIDRRFSWTKTTLVGSNDAAQIWFKTHTKNDGQYFVGCVKNAAASIVWHFTSPFLNIIFESLYS